MMTIQTAVMDGKPVGALRSRFRGALLRPGEEGYDEARHLWNGATAQPDGSVLAGRAPEQAERLSPLPHLSGLGRTLCAS